LLGGVGVVPQRTLTMTVSSPAHETPVLPAMSGGAKRAAVVAGLAIVAVVGFLMRPRHVTPPVEAAAPQHELPVFQASPAPVPPAAPLAFASPSPTSIPVVSAPSSHMARLVK